MAATVAPDGSAQRQHQPVRAAERIRNTLSRRQRLTDAGAFSEAFTHGRGYPGRYMVLRVRCGDDATMRLGVATGKRALRRSVDRVRARRLLREAFRRNRAKFSGKCDVVLVARSAIRDATHADVEEELLRLARKAGLREGRPSRGA
jgi:ribonuclease P protein component